jgi:hypothetical protein
MSFTLHQVTQRASGEDIVRTKNITAAEPVIGRGTDCDIQIADLAVSLRHAVMRQLGRGRVEVKALGQLSFEANGAFTRNAQLSLADRPKLVFGSHELRLAPGAGAGEVVVTLSRTESVAGEPDVQDEKTVFRLSSSMFSRRRASWAFLGLLLLFCLALPVAAFVFYRSVPVTAATRPSLPRADVQWESHSLTPGHRFLEGDCQACHQRAFVAVRDDACLACHRQGLAKDVAARLQNPVPALDHAPLDRLAKAGSARAGLTAAIARLFNHPDGRCESCHTEHVDPGPAAKGTSVTSNEIVGNDCAVCHSDLRRRLPGTALRDVAGWDSHPDFRPLLSMSLSGPRVRVALSEKTQENDGLIFRHDMHLSKQGGVARMAQRLGKGAALACESCHHQDASGRYYQPVKMRDDCSSCHSLAFAHTGGKIMLLQHGDAKAVISQLKKFYAAGAQGDTSDLFLGRPGFDRVSAAPMGDPVARGVTAAFSRGGACYGCHTIVQPPPGSLDYDVVHPHLTVRYLPWGGFDHSVPEHRADASGREICSSCHKVETLKPSSDVLLSHDAMLPQIARCAACHGRSKSETQAAASSACGECHGYHDPGKPALNAGAFGAYAAKSPAL